ncbi:TIM barrel protein [Candidatus Latescibacterota bacterium]
MKKLYKTFVKKDIDVDIRPELTGKYTQFGSLDEIIQLSLDIKGVYPCIDWSHLHAKTGVYNTAHEFQSIIDTLRDKLGETALKKVHFHISGIEYGPKGEKRHLDLVNSDFNYQGLLHVLKDNNVCGFVICESPSIEDDALLLKDYYEKI